jgi:hypothetical protein
MAQVSMVLVRSLVSRHTAAELKTKWDAAAADLEESMNGGVVVVGANMKESGTTGIHREGELEKLVLTYERAYRMRLAIDAGKDGGASNPAMSHISFAARPWGF